MAKEVKVAGFECGNIKLLSGDKSSSREVVLSLEADRLLMKMIRIPVDSEENAKEYAGKVLSEISPYPDDHLSVSLETVRETDKGRIVIAAALPESSADDIAEALDAAKLNVTRIDSAALGTLRKIWPRLPGKGRKLVILRGKTIHTILVLDGDQPSAIRAVNVTAPLKRELMLSLIEAEDFGGARALEKIFVVTLAPLGDSIAISDEDLSGFASVEEIVLADEDTALLGVKERSFEEGTINALPDSWYEVLHETRFKTALKNYLGLFAFVWVLLAAAIFAAPKYFDYKATEQKKLCNKHALKYQEVLTMREKVNIVRKYSDHDRGALEIMKAISDRLPKEIELSNWSFIREDEENERDSGLRISGESTSFESVIAFKVKVEEMGVFESVKLNGPQKGKNGKDRFDLQCNFVDTENAQ